MGRQVRCGRRACIMPARSPFGQRSRARDAVSSTRRERPEPLDHEVRHGQRSRLPRSPSSPPRTRTRRPRRVITTRRPPIGSLVPATRCTLACTRERRPRSLPVIVRRLAPIRPSPPASEDLAESAGFVNEKPPVSSCDIGGRQSGRGGSNSRHSAWEAVGCRPPGRGGPPMRTNGAGGIRTPEAFRPVRFQVGCFQPLSHRSFELHGRAARVRCGAGGISCRGRRPRR